MPWMRKAEREKLDEQYELIIATVKKNPGLFFEELSALSGIQKPRLRPCLIFLLRKNKITAESRYNSETENMANKYYPVFSVNERSMVGINQDDLDWLAFWRLPKKERDRVKWETSLIWE